MDQQECKINTAHILRQVINERDNPRSIFREAISNSKDADANRMKIVVEKKNNGKKNVSFLDNGTGMTYQELCNFFNIGYSNKNDSKIGEKGLGKKLFFNCESILVETKSETGGMLKGRLNSPLSLLKKGKIPQFIIEKFEDGKFNGYNTKIFLNNVKIHDDRHIFWGNNLENYILWKTAGGTFEHFFQKNKLFKVELEIKNNGKSKSLIINGHLFPETNVCDNPDNFAFRFNTFEFEIKVGKKISKIQVMGAIAGADAHIIKNRSIKKQFKGFFLCKDYFIIQDINKELFGGGTGEWQNMHILVNCQDINLSMGREGFINKDEGTVFHAVIEAIKIFKNCIIKGEPFVFNSKLIEKNENFAGKGYAQLKAFKERKNIEEIKCIRLMRLMQLDDSKKLSENYSSLMLYEPNSRISTYSLFLELLSKKSIKDSFTIYDAAIEDKNISLLMKKKNGHKYEKPLFYTVEHIINSQILNKLQGKYQGLICWDIKNIKHKDLTCFKDVIILKDIMC